MDGDNEIIDDEWAAFEEEETDRVLRQRFDAVFPVGDSSLEVLDEIRPAVTRARRRYVAQRAVSFSVAASLLLGVGAVAVDQLVSPDGGSVFAGPAESGEDDGANPDGGETSALPLPMPSADGSGPDGGASSLTASGASSKDLDDPTTTADSASGDATDPSASLTTSQTTAVSTGPGSSDSPATTTTTPSTTATSLQGSCGYLTYAIDGYQSISLVSAVATGPFPVRAEAEGPETIKVTFDGAGTQCDLEVKYADGQLVTTVGGEDDEDDDDDHH
jgi:hypothetical protein